MTTGWIIVLFLKAEDRTSDIEKSISTGVAGIFKLIVGLHKLGYQKPWRQVLEVPTINQRPTLSPGLAFLAALEGQTVLVLYLISLYLTPLHINVLF